jgi:hypothetical protein
MNRVQDFEKFISRIPLQECTQQHIRDYLSIKSQGKNIKDRQIARMDESLRLLFAEYFRFPVPGPGRLCLCRHLLRFARFPHLFRLPAIPGLKILYWWQWEPLSCRP